MAALLAMLMTALSLTATSRQAQAATAADVYDWYSASYDTRGEMYVYPGTYSYALASRTASYYHSYYLGYGQRDYGINLVWRDRPADANITFMRRPGDTGPLRYGESVAIRVAGGGYLKYGSRSDGINLVWSSTPAYEWRFSGEGRIAGERVGVAHRFGLYNATAGAHMVYGARNYGINLVWKQ